jgi:hypothetical protein
MDHEKMPRHKGIYSENLLKTLEPYLKKLLLPLHKKVKAEEIHPVKDEDNKVPVQNPTRPKGMKI